VSGALRAAAAALALSALAACAPVEGRHDAEARQIYQDVRNGAVERVLARMPEAQRTQGARDALATAGALLPRDARAEVTLLGAVRQNEEGGVIVRTRHQYLYPDRVVVARTDLRFAREGAATLLGFHIDGGSRAAAANRFTLSGKSAAHYAMLAFGALSGAAMLGAGAFAATTRRLRVRWLWAAAAFVGAGVVSMDWASGVITVQSLTLSLWKVGVFRGPGLLDAWVVQVPAPLGAIAALVAALRVRSVRASSGS
jgi:hypothetical protein